MKIFTPCWGEKHIKLLETCLGASFRFPKNASSLAHSEWVFLCNGDEAHRVERIAELIIPSSKIRIIRGGDMMTAMLDVMESCVRDKDPMLMATPDFIYGDGTIDAFNKIGVANTCVSIAHMRVHPSILPFIQRGFTFPNDELMQLGMDHQHISWTNCEEGHKESMSYTGGIRWVRHDNMHLIRHYLPSPFYVNFTQSDLDFFKGKTFNFWDHLWPTSLILALRLRYIGSSDAAMMLEVTDVDANVPQILEAPAFHASYMHNQIQSQFVSVFRGKK